MNWDICCSVQPFCCIGEYAFCFFVGVGRLDFEEFKVGLVTQEIFHRPMKRTTLVSEGVIVVDIVTWMRCFGNGGGGEHRMLFPPAPAGENNFNLEGIRPSDPVGSELAP